MTTATPTQVCYPQAAHASRLDPAAVRALHAQTNAERLVADVLDFEVDAASIGLMVDEPTMTAADLRDYGYLVELVRDGFLYRAEREASA